MKHGIMSMFCRFYGRIKALAEDHDPYTLDVISKNTEGLQGIKMKLESTFHGVYKCKNLGLNPCCGWRLLSV